MALLDRQDDNEFNNPMIIDDNTLSQMISVLPLHLQLNVVRTNKDFNEMSREQAIQACKYLYSNHLIMEQGYKQLLKQEMINNGSIPLNFK